MSETPENYEGHCGCGELHYKVSGQPLIVHCCHCRYCQRQSGSAFAINALYTTDNVEVTRGSFEEIDTPSPSGKGQTIARCPSCKVAVWSNYFMGGLRKKIRFIRVGTLTNPDLLPPDIHIYTESKQPWIQFTPNDKSVEQYYDWKEVWTEENRNIVTTMREALKAEN
jgi:hypothetical protein